MEDLYTVEAEFGGETPITMEAGSWDWTPFSAALTIPADIIAGDAPEENPRALRFFIHHEPPEDDFARASFDDLAVITWGDERLDAKNGALTEGPNTWDFLRVEAPEGAYTAEITLRAFAPAAAASR